jgi:hypothetical protein
MKKVMVTISMAVCLLTTVHAQSSSEYEAMNEWLFGYMLNGVTPQSDMNKYDEIKQEWSQFGDEIYDKIKASLPPIDPSITAAINKLYADFDAEVEQKAIALGYASFDDLYMKTYKGEQIPNDEVKAFYEWRSQKYDEIHNQKTELTKAYDDELSNRFHAAFIDAVKKLQQNSASMQ